MEGMSLCFFKDETSFKGEKNFKIKIIQNIDFSFKIIFILF